MQLSAQHPDVKIEPIKPHVIHDTIDQNITIADFVYGSMVEKIKTFFLNEIQKLPLPPGYTRNDIIDTFTRWDDLPKMAERASKEWKNMLQKNVYELGRNIYNYSHGEIPQYEAIKNESFNLWSFVRDLVDHINHSVRLYATQARGANERAGQRLFYDINKQMSSVSPVLDTYVDSTTSIINAELEKRMKQKANCTRRRRVTSSRRKLHPRAKRTPRYLSKGATSRRVLLRRRSNNGKGRVHKPGRTRKRTK